MQSGRHEPDDSVVLVEPRRPAMIVAVAQDARGQPSGEAREHGSGILLTPLPHEGSNDVNGLEIFELRTFAREILRKATFGNSQLAIATNNQRTTERRTSLRVQARGDARAPKRRSRRVPTGEAPG